MTRDVVLELHLDRGDPVAWCLPVVAVLAGEFESLRQLRCCDALLAKHCVGTADRSARAPFTGANKIVNVYEWQAH